MKMSKFIKRPKVKLSKFVAALQTKQNWRLFFFRKNFNLKFFFLFTYFFWLKQDCNRCRCSPSGRWMCTKKLCLSTTERPEIQLRQSSLTGDSSCKPGTRFKKNCNWCMCSNTGLAICTLKGCFVERPRIPIVNNSIVDRESSVERFRRQTQQEPPVYTPEDLKNPNFTCTPNYTFKVDCNTCWCSADGRRPRYCTRIACNNNNNINNSYPTLPPLPPATTEE